MMYNGNYGGVAYPQNDFNANNGINSINGGVGVVPNNGFSTQYPYNSFNNYFPDPNRYLVGQNPTTAQQGGNGIIWVQGSEGAKAYPVAKNNTVVLWDSETPVIYIKSADASGKPTTRTFDLTERTSQPQTIDIPPAKEVVEYATKDEFDALTQKVEELLQKENARQERFERKKGGAVNNG